jgi:hypothetical protein
MEVLKDSPIFSKVSLEILLLVKQTAKTQGLSVSEYVRFLILADLQHRGLLDHRIAADGIERFITSQ